MKKILFVAVLAGFAITSCKKVYTCECTTTDSSDPNSILNSTSTHQAELRKKDAKDWCGESSSSVSDPFGTLTTECKLK